MTFPRPIEAGNSGDGAPLTLGDPGVRGDVFLTNGDIAAIDWDGDGAPELVDSGSALFAYRFVGSLPDGTPVIDRGLRLGEMSRSHQRDEADAGLCGHLLAHADFDGDGHPEVLLGPRGYSRKPVVVLSRAGGWPADRDAGRPLRIDDGTVPDPAAAVARWTAGPLTAFDWDGDGRPDLVAAVQDTAGYNAMEAHGGVPEDARDRYTRDGRWRGRLGGWTLHLLRNDCSPGVFRFAYAGAVDLPEAPPGGPLAPVDPADPTAGLLLLGYYGEVYHLPLPEPGAAPRWGAWAELFSLHGAPFCRGANFTSLATAVVASRQADRGPDLFAGDISSNACWCRWRGRDRDGRPVYDDPRKVKQADPHVNGGYFSVPTTGDWRATGKADLLVGSIEGYVFWYKTLSTDPLRFAPPERVRVGDQEIRRYAKPHPAAGYHWGSSQGPHDGFNGGYSNPVLVDWDGDGLLDLLVGDMIGLFDWYPNRGTPTRPALAPPLRLHLGAEPLFGPWRVQAGAGDFSGTGLPDLVTMDLDLDLSLYPRVGGDDLAGLRPGVKLRYEDGGPIKTHGVYTPAGGDGRGRTKIHVVDWDGDGRLDLVLGVGPQQGSAFRSSYVLLCRNLGTNAQPVFARPEVLLYERAGERNGRPLEFWRHGAHAAPVDWDGDGRWELVVGADMGNVWYFSPEHFGAPAAPPDIVRPAGHPGL